MNIADSLALLGLEPDAAVEAVRARYRELVKESPPERDPERFARIHAAYQVASDPRARAVERVLGPPPYSDIEDLKGDLRRQPRRPLGPGAWLEVLRR